MEELCPTARIILVRGGSNSGARITKTPALHDTHSGRCCWWDNDKTRRRHHERNRQERISSCAEVYWGKQVPVCSICQSTIPNRLFVHCLLQRTWQYPKNNKSLKDFMGSWCRDSFLCSNHGARLSWARNDNWWQRVCEAAAKCGRLNFLQYLLQETTWHRNTWKTITKAAARYGHIRILEWILTEQGAGYLQSLGTMLCNAAAYGGHLVVQMWARANGCPWNTWTYSSAARGGHLEVLQWAYANGCPWDNNTWEGCDDPIMREWLIAYHCPGSSQ